MRTSNKKIVVKLTPNFFENLPSLPSKSWEKLGDFQLLTKKLGVNFETNFFPDKDRRTTFERNNQPENPAESWQISSGNEYCHD
jgi:hypothetical protein